MSSERTLLAAAIDLELKSRLAVLRARPYPELASLPKARTERAVILGKAVSFTVFRETHGDMRLLVLLRSDKPILFGMGSSGRTEGFWVTPADEKAEALDEDILDFFA